MHAQGKPAALVAITAALTLATGTLSLHHPQGHPQAVDNHVDNPVHSALITPDESDLRLLKAASRSRQIMPAVAPRQISKFISFSKSSVVKPLPRLKPAPKALIRTYEQPSVSRGTLKGYAESLVGSQQFSCLDPLWEHESGWSVYSANSSGAYGIPQALPGSKMASAGSDWRTNGRTQIRWGIGYIHDRYGTPCAAYAHWQSNNWY
jgi:hypothetical protein